LSWFGNLAETYNRLTSIVGVADEKGNILLPPNHMAMNTDVCVTIDGQGNFCRAEAGKLNIPIPCTEDSASRTSAPAAHPLHEQIGYLAPDEKRRGMYFKQLAAWSGYHPKVEAVCKYVEGGTLIGDLQASGIEAENPKLFVRFSVQTPGDLTPHLWEDSAVAAAWQAYCETTQPEDKTLCYVTGETAPVNLKHPKGVNPAANGAKLISCNDEANYTYRGRFIKPYQANAISAKASHQAHAMLKYLIATQGYRCDSQAIVAWAVEDGSAAPPPLASTQGLLDSLGVYNEPGQTETDKVIAAVGELDSDFAKKFRSALAGKGNARQLQNYGKRHIAVLVVDAATTGRMAVTYYQDLPENEYIDRIVSWHASCRWWFWEGGRAAVSTPSADRIIAAVFGEPRGEGYDKIRKQGRERLLHCILNGERIDRGRLDAAVKRVSNPFSYDKQDGGWDKPKWENAVSVACAIVRKYYTDKKEEFSLELDSTCRDRDYLYGRLLALADRIESYARYRQTGGNDTDKRPTNAVRYMSAFAVKPFRTWNLIRSQQLPPYMQYLYRIGIGEWYQRQIDAIMALFPENTFESDSNLSGKYLMGYSLQRRALNTKNMEEETEYAEQKD